MLGNPRADRSGVLSRRCRSIPTATTVEEELARSLSGWLQLKILHAGTRCHDERPIAAGGRVFRVIALGGDIERACPPVDPIDWPGGCCRRDIGRMSRP